MKLTMRDVGAFKIAAFLCMTTVLVGNYEGSKDLMLFGPICVLLLGVFLEGLTIEARRESAKRRAEERKP